jgi:hypothetical protein
MTTWDLHSTMLSNLKDSHLKSGKTEKNFKMSSFQLKSTHSYPW